MLFFQKVCEVATQVFITQDKPNVAGLILAGSADFKNELNTTQMFDPRLQVQILKKAFFNFFHKIII